MSDIWIKIKFWTKATLITLLAIYGALFIYNNTGVSREVTFWWWIQKEPKTSVFVLAFLSFLTGDAAFHFANAPAAIGTAAIGDAVNGFFASINACSHEIDNAWAPPSHAICQGNVCYTRLDGSTLTLAFVNIFIMRQGKICDYRIYVDASELYVTLR